MRDGSVVVARSFYDLSKSRIEGLAGAFPKLISKEQQHTFVENDQVRYLFKTLDSFGYLLVVTSKNSNVLQDMDVLNACAAQLSDLCPTIAHDGDQSSASKGTSVYSKKKFEILFLFDELVHQGLKQSLTSAQLSRILSMESHDEIIENAIQKRKEKEAKEQNKLRIKQIEMQKKELAKGSRSEPQYSTQDYGMHKMVNVAMEISKTAMSDASRMPSYADAGAGKGLKLGKSALKKTTIDIFGDGTGQYATEPEGNLSRAREKAISTSSGKPAYTSTQTEPIAVAVEEFISATIGKDSQLESFDVRGSLSLSVVDSSYAAIRLCLQEFASDKNLQIKTHPNINKDLFADERVLEMRDPSKPFPCNQNLGLLKWKYSSVSRSEDDYLPVSINLWPSQSEHGEVEMSIEFECKNKSLFPIKDLLFRFPCPESFQVSAIDGEYSYNQSFGSLDWSVPVVNAKSPSGCIAFSAKGVEIQDIFPIQISFQMEKSVFNFDLERVAPANEPNKSLDAVEKKVSCQAENFIIQY